MKKIIAFILAIGTVLLLPACAKQEEKKTSEFIELGNKQTLFVGSGYMARNYEVSTTTEQYLTYDVQVNYSLKRSSYSSSSYVYYNNYYYYWETTKVQEEELLGTLTTTTSYVFSYLPYGSDQANLAVKTVASTQYTYNYSYLAGFIKKDREVNIQLNGMFDTWEALCAASNELANLIDTEETKRYYITTSKPTQTESAIKQYTNTYYYIQ